MINLTANKRESGSQQSQEMRQAGMIPAVVYGSGVENTSLSVNKVDFMKAFAQAGETSLISLDVDGKKMTVLVKDMSFDPLTDAVTHVDFYAPNLKEETTANVPLVFVGESAAVNDLKGMLVKNLHELEVKCLPQDIPHEIQVDISKLVTFEDHVYVKDIKVSDKVHILKNPEEIVVLAAPPQNVEAELETPIVEDVEKVEKIEKERKEDEPADEAAKE